MSSIDSSTLNSAALATQIGVAVAVKSQDAAKAAGQAALAMLQSAAVLQQQITASAPLPGGRLDVRG